MSDASLLSPYPSPDAREDELDRLAARAGAEVIVYGESVERRPLRAARVPARAAKATRLLCSANIHGIEYIGGRVALGLLAACAEPEGPLAALLERCELWVIPCLNPDGYARTWAASGQAARLSELRANARGVDLNRNFPLPHGARPTRLPAAGSDRPGDATYRGPAPLSEPETAHLDTLLQAQRFHASANLHSFMGTVIPARVTGRAPYKAYRGLARAFAAAQTQARYRRLASRVFDVFTGEQEDHQHHARDCWAVCVEVFPVLSSLRQHWRAPSRFWRFNPHDPRPWVESDRAAVIAYFQAALELPRPSAMRARALAPARDGGDRRDP
ncbi:MAG: M14 family metallopeptidase [Nannocystaceae bacterium]